MKYYIYISDAKIDMLFPQVPHEIKKKTASEFKLDIKLFSASRKTEVETEENRIARLEAVVDFIQEYGNVGTVDDPEEYVEGNLPMRWANYSDMFEETPVVYFGAETERTILGLGGSMKHLIGASGADIGKAHSASATPYLMRYLLKELNLHHPNAEHEKWMRLDREQGRPELTVLDAVALATPQMQGPFQNVEFLAKRLASGQADFRELDKQVLLATPLYIATSD